MKEESLIAADIYAGYVVNILNIISNNTEPTVSIVVRNSTNRTDRLLSYFVFINIHETSDLHASDCDYNFVV